MFGDLMKDDFAKMLADHPEWADWTYDDFSAELCRLKAEDEDRERRRTKVYRDNGYLSPYDWGLLISVSRNMGLSDDATAGDILNLLRLKKRRGHKQQELLEALEWSGVHRAKLPDDQTIDRLEEIFRSREGSGKKV